MKSISYWRNKFKNFNNILPTAHYNFIKYIINKISCNKTKLNSYFIFMIRFSGKIKILKFKLLMQQRRSWKWIGRIIFSLKIIIMTEIRDWWFWPIIKIILKLECYFFLFRLGSLSVFLIIHFIVCVKILYFGFIIWHALWNLFLFRNIHFFFNVLWIHISFLILTVSMDSERLIRFINVL
jgi:hypothetical protein